MLAGIPGLAIDGDIKLGFQAHYPQLETKLAARGADEADLARRLAPVEAEVRKRLGNFVIAEDEQKFLDFDNLTWILTDAEEVIFDRR